MSLADRAAAVVLRWARTYTRRLPPGLAEERRNELASDLWEQQALATQDGTPAWQAATSILRRMVAGMPADLVWRRAALATVHGTSRTPVSVAPQLPPPRRDRPRTTRRVFLRRSLGVGSLSVLGGFGAATTAFLWPDLRGAFGGLIEAGDIDDIVTAIHTNRVPFEVPAARTYLVAYDPAMDPGGQYAAVTADGTSPVMALYWRCAHLGCRVPWCITSQWLECPCHGSAYNRWGEWQDGPAPRGLDRFPVSIQDGIVVIDTSKVVTGPPRRISVLDQPRSGPACVFATRR
jgi:cytochrome b6-f complex iron-sulfur subunit